jgi:hypothetical protein
MRRERNEWDSEVPKARATDSPALKSVRQAVGAVGDIVDQSEQAA